MTRGEEHYEGFGAVPTFTYRVDGASAPAPEAVEALYANRGRALGIGLDVLFKGYFGQIPLLLGLRPPGRFNDLDELPVRRLPRLALALRAIVLAPLLLPYAAAVQAHRAFTRSSLAQRRQQA